MSTPAILASIETWLSGEATKAKAVLLAFEPTAVKDWETAVSEVEKYAGPIAVALLGVAKQLGVTQLEAFATANLPILEAQIASGLTAVGMTGAAATSAATTMASATMTAIVSAATAAMAIVVAPK